MAELYDQKEAFRRKLLRWLPALLWMGLIFTLSSFSYPGYVVRFFRFQDKLIHLVEFGILGILLARALRPDDGAGQGRYWSAFALAALFGALDELHQAFVPGRMLDWRDFVADCLGAMIFIQIWAAAKKEGFISAPPEVESK